MLNNWRTSRRERYRISFEYLFYRDSLHLLMIVWSLIHWSKTMRNWIRPTKRILTSIGGGWSLTKANTILNYVDNVGMVNWSLWSCILSVHQCKVSSSFKAKNSLESSYLKRGNDYLFFEKHYPSVPLFILRYILYQIDHSYLLDFPTEVWLLIKRYDSFRFTLLIIIWICLITLMKTSVFTLSIALFI